jgi:hypothetical protein
VGRAGGFAILPRTRLFSPEPNRSHLISHNVKEIKQVIDDAHTCLKITFFDLLPENIVTRLETAT